MLQRSLLACAVSMKFVLVPSLVACGGTREDRPIDPPSEKPASPSRVSKAPSDAAAPATEIVFAPARKEGMIIRCSEGCAGNLYADDAGALALKVSGPAGTKVQLRNQELVLGAQPVDLTLDGLYLGLVAGDRVTIPVRTVSADGHEKKLALVLEPREIVARLFKTVTTGPVKLPREIKAKYEADLLVQLGDSGHLTPVSADDDSTHAALYQVDFIELAKTSERDEPPCKYQVAFGDNAGAQRTVGRKSTSLTSTVYARRTGKVAATRTFGAIVKPCPKETQAGTSLDAIYDDDAYRRWLKSFVKKQREDDEEESYPPPTLEGGSVVGAAVAIPSLDEVRKRFGKVGKEDKDDVYREKDSNDDMLTINGKRGADQVLVQVYDIGSTTPKGEPKGMIKVTSTYALKVEWASSSGDEFGLPRALELANGKAPWATSQALDDAFKAAGYAPETTTPQPPPGVGIQSWIPRVYKHKDDERVQVTFYDLTKPGAEAVMKTSGTRMMYVRGPSKEIAQRLLSELTGP